MLKRVCLIVSAMLLVLPLIAGCAPQEENKPSANSGYYTGPMAKKPGANSGKLDK